MRVRTHTHTHTHTHTVGRDISREDDSDDILCLGLETLLAFITGADHLPPLGFVCKPKICFTHSKVSKLPTASTCTPALYVPVHLTDYSEFKSALTLHYLVPMCLVKYDFIIIFVSVHLNSVWI